MGVGVSAGMVFLVDLRSRIDRSKLISFHRPPWWPFCGSWHVFASHFRGKLAICFVCSLSYIVSSV